MADKWIQLMSEDGTDNLFPTSKMDLLWTNASPNSSFDSQTVALDLSGYKFVGIVIKFYIDKNGYSFTIIPVPVTNYSAISVTSDTDTDVRYRMVTTTSNGVSFGVGRNTGDTTTNNGRAIPQKIYGIK